MRGSLFFFDKMYFKKGVLEVLHSKKYIFDEDWCFLNFSFYLFLYVFFMSGGILVYLDLCYMLHRPLSASSLNL